METAEEVEDKKKKEHRVLSVDKITVEKIVLESSCGSREVLLTKNESSRKLSIESETGDTIPKEYAKPELGINEIKKASRIKPIRLTKRPSIGSIVIAGLKSVPSKTEEKETDVQGENEENEIEKINAKNRLEKSRTNIEELQQNLGTKIDADTAEKYKRKLLESREKALKPVDSNANEKGRVAFDEEFLQKHNLDKRLKIEEYEPTGTTGRLDEEEPRLTEKNARPSYSEKVSEVEKRWSGEFLKNQLDRRSSESSRSSYVEECSVSSRESVEEYDDSERFEREDRKTEFGSHSAIDLSGNQTSEENLGDSTLSTVGSGSCLEDRIKSLDEDIEARGEIETAREDECEESERQEELAGSEWKEESRDSRIDGYASLIKEFTMEAGCSRARKEEKPKKKLGLRRLLPGFFSPKDSRKEYKKKEGKDRKRPDDRYFARYQQNGNYTRSPDTMNLNEDIKRNVKLDNSLNGSMIEERLDEIKRELFPEQGLITSTPDHLARDEDRSLARDQGHPRSYTTDSSLSSIAPDDRWNNERNLGISPDIRKFEQRQKREEFGQRYGQLERKHSLQEPKPYFFQRNHGPSGRISAPPAERYFVRPRAIHPIDRPLPAIPRSRTELIDYDENYLAEEDETREQIGYGKREQRHPSEPGFYENDPTSGLILKSVSAQVKITRQPIVNQNQRAPLVGRSPKYLSSGSSHKSGDYGDSSCTPNSSQKSEFSPTSSKSGEYYLHSPRNSASPNEKEGIYENEKSPSRSSTRCMDERIYDETPSSPCEKGSYEDALNRRTASPRRRIERSVSPRESAEKREDAQRREEPATLDPSTSETRGKSISPSRQSLSRRSRPNEQILIASPKRESFETRIPRPTESRRCARESPVQITSAPRELVDSFDASGQDSAGNVAPARGQGSPAKIPRPEPVYGHRGGQLVPGSPTRVNVQRKDPEDTVAWTRSSPQKNEPTSPQTRNPNPIAAQRVPQQQQQQQQQQQIEVSYVQRIGEPMYGSRTATGSLSPSKQQTRQHLEAFYWQQKALEAHRKSLASPTNVGQRQMGRKIDLPEVREAVYWQQLKKLDEEQQRRIYEQNAMEEPARCKIRAKNPTRTPAARQQESVQNLSMPGCGDLRCPKGNPTGKPPLMQTQKGQNQPVLIVRPQQAIRDRREIPSKPVDASRQEAQRSKSASPHFHRNDPQPRKLQVSSIYEDGKAPPAPIFKRGSLVGGEPTTVEYATGSGAKRVSFSNQSAAGGRDLATGNWPTKRGTAPEPPTRRHRSEDSVSDTDSVFLHQREAGTDEYDADRPLPPLPKDPRIGPGGTVPCGDVRWNSPRPPTGAQRPQKEEEWNSDGKGRQSNDTGGSGRGESEAGSNEVRRGGSGGGGVGSIGSGAGSVLGVGGSGSGSVVGGSGGRSGSGGGGRSRDEPRRHTLGGDHQPSLHHQQFNAAQQLHPLHPHHLPPPHGQYGTPPTRHTTMDLEMGTKSRQRKSPLPRGYPPPSSTMLFDDDPGIMSEVETSSTGFRRGGKQRSSLPVVRTPSKTLERPLGLVFLQYRNETKRALLPNEITSIDTVKALFVRSFPKQLTMEYLDSPHVKVYIHDSNKDMFYELEDLRSHLRDIRDRSVLRLFESSDGVTGMPGPLGIPGSGLPPHWEDQSYFSEPEFDSEYQHQHIHKSKTAKNSNSNSGYYVGGSSTLPRGGQMMRAYSPAASSVVGGPTATPTQAKPIATPDRLHGESGYMSSPERGGGVGSGSGRYPPGPYSAGSSYEDPYYSQYSGTVTPVIDEEARIRVEHMERQLANLTGLVQKALTHAPHTSPSPRDYLQVPAGRDPYARGPVSQPAVTDDSYLRTDVKPPKLGKDKSVSFEKSVSFSDEPPDMNSPKQHSPQHAADTKPTKPAIKSSTLPRMSSQERDRHKPTPPPKPAALVAGQYVYRDLALTPEMYNQLRGLQKKAKDLRQEVRHLRRMSQAQAHTIRETILDTFITIRTMLLSCGDAAWDAEKIRLTREEDLYRQEMLRLVKDLTELENTVEELRGNVINRKTRVNMSDVENMALIMSKSSKTVADLKVRFPSLQEGMKGLLSSEMEMVVRAEKFLKEEPERLESALKRCKKLTSTLVTLKRLASVQEQRLPNAATSVDAEETPPITPTSAQHSKAAAPVPAERTVVGSASVLGGGPHAHEPPATHQQRPENALDALLDELQTFSRPSSQLGHTQGSSTIISELGRSASRGEAVGASSTVGGGRPPCISDIGRKGSVDSSSGPLPGTLVPNTAVLPSTQGGTLRRLHSYPSSSDTDTSPPIARLQVSLQEQPSLPTLPQGFVPGQKPPVPERNAELLQLASARRVPPPPPPRTSSRSPLASPTSPQLPPRNHSCALQGNATLRRPPARGALPVKEGKPPMALPAEVVASEASPALHNNSTSSQSSAVLSTSNSSSCESVNSQEGLQSKKGRHEQLEQRHQELLRKQKALQEQYARLQQLQRNTAGLTTVPPAPPDLLKKTGSESNLLAKMGLGLSAASSGSLTSLAQAKPGVPQESSVDGTRTRLDDVEQQQQQQQQQQSVANENSTIVGSSESDGGQSVAATTTTTTPASGTATTTTTSKIYETDIL